MHCGLEATSRVPFASCSGPVRERTTFLLFHLLVSSPDCGWLVLKPKSMSIQCLFKIARTIQDSEQLAVQ